MTFEDKVKEYKNFIIVKENNEYSAIDILQKKIIELDPQNPFAFYNRGMIYLKQENEDKACEDFHASCRLGNKNACKAVMARCIEL